MLSSVFSRRKGIQRKLTNFTHIRRAQSPPSPGSFATPEISDKPFNPYSLYNHSTSQHSVNQPAFTLSPPSHSGQSDSSKTGSPRVQLDFSAEVLSLSDWFPAELLQGRSESPARRPERNVSLGVTGPTSGTSGYHAGSAYGRTQEPVAGGSGTVAGDSMTRISELGAENDEELQAESGHGFSADDVIVIEASRGRDPNPSPLASSIAANFELAALRPRSASKSPPNQRPTPQPIKIPVNTNKTEVQVENPDDQTFDSQSRKRSPLKHASQASKAEASSSSRPTSRYSQRRSRHHSLTRTKSRHASVRKSRHPSLTRPKSRAHSYSRPSSLNSRCSDTDADLDDGMSAISGTTIARALVSSYILSPSPSAWNPQPSRGRGHLARQDSATLPKGDFPFVFNRKSIRSSKGSVASTGALSGGNYWRDRKISGDQIVILSPEERQRENWEVEVPPVPPMPEGLSPGPSARSSSFSAPDPKSRRNSPDGNGITNLASASLFKRQSSISISSRRATKELTLDPDPGRKRRRISKASESTNSAAVSFVALSSSTSSGTMPSAYSTQPTTEPASRNSVVCYGTVPHSNQVGDQSTLYSGPLAAIEGIRDEVDEEQELIYTRSPRARHASSPDAPTTATSASLSVYSDERHVRSATSPAESGSMYSGTHSPASTAVLSPGLTSIISFSSPGSSSVRTPGSSLSSAGSREPIFRSFAGAKLQRSDSPSKLPVAMLPIGERPRSAQVPHSPSSPNVSPEGTRPQSMLASGRTSSMDSPDLLDIMFAASRPPLFRSSSNGAALRVGSPPAPISVPPRTTPSTTGFELVEGELDSPSVVQQRFPETPYAFTPLVSAGFASPSLPPGSDDVPPPLSRPGTISLRGAKASRATNALGRSVLMRSASLASPPVSASNYRPKMPASPPLPATKGALQDDANAVYGTEENGVAGRLCVIEENSAPSTPGDEQPSYLGSPRISPAPSHRSASPDSVNSLATKPEGLPSPPTPPVRSPTPSSVSLPASPLPSPSLLKRKHSFLVEINDASSPASPSMSQFSDAGESLNPTQLVVQFPRAPFPEDVRSAVSHAPSQQLRPGYSSLGQTKVTRTRPPPPTGPRKLSVTGSHLSVVNRTRAGSVSSVGSSPSISGTTTSNYPSVHVSSPSPRFQTTSIQFRGLTMEAAQWEFTSDQLQQIVSAAIKQSSDAAAIRLLPIQTFVQELPGEIDRLELLCSELKTKYKLGMRKRTKLLGTLLSIADGGELVEHTASLRHLEELAELSNSLDHTAEELYQATDQLRQLTHLQDKHSSSALMMALRKLNTSFIKHLAENSTLRQQVAALEDERDDAWKHAQDAAQELDALADRYGISEGVITPASSRRSSRVVIARKTSIRKAELRSPSRLRSQRSSITASIATDRSSLVTSPSTRASTSDVIPPVPALPIRTPLGILTSGLPTRSSGISSPTPSSEVRAMMRAQEELYEMLGIQVDDLYPRSTANRQRSMSMSAVNATIRSNFRDRHNSEVLGSTARKSDAWQHHYRSRSIDDRTAVLATIGVTTS